MFKIKVSNNIIDYATELVKEHNYGNRGVADGSKSEQLTGIIGQCTIQTLFHVDVITGNEGFDHGEDLNYNGLSIDVKTMGRTTDVKDYYVNNFIALQRHFPTDVYIFCSYYEEVKELTVCGWLPKDELKKKAKFYKREPNAFDLIKHGSRPRRTFMRSQIKNYIKYNHPKILRNN